MILLADEELNLTKLSPETINRGSSGASEIVLIAPIPSDAIIYITLTLPNGIILNPYATVGVQNKYAMTLLEGFNAVEIQTALGYRMLNAWKYEIPYAVTQYSGTVEIQFIANFDGRRFTTSTTLVEVQTGNPYIDPTFDGDGLDQLIGSIRAEVSAQVDALRSDGEFMPLQLKTFVKHETPIIGKLYDYNFSNFTTEVDPSYVGSTFYSIFDSSGTGGIYFVILQIKSISLSESKLTAQCILQKNIRGEQGPQGPTGATGPQGRTGPTGPQGAQGEGFSIFAVYDSESLMEADASNVPEGKFVLIANSVEDETNGRLYVKTSTGFNLLGDFSGPQGIQGPQGPQGPQGAPGVVPIVQGTGDSQTTVMSQKAVTDEFQAFQGVLDGKLSKVSIVQTTGDDEQKIMSQKAVTDALGRKLNNSDVVNQRGSSITKVMSQFAVTDSLNNVSNEIERLESEIYGALNIVKRDATLVIKSYKDSSYQNWTRLSPTPLDKSRIKFKKVYGSTETLPPINVLPFNDFNPNSLYIPAVDGIAPYNSDEQNEDEQNKNKYVQVTTNEYTVSGSGDNREWTTEIILYGTPEAEGTYTIFSNQHVPVSDTNYVFCADLPSGVSEAKIIVTTRDARDETTTERVYTVPRNTVTEDGNGNPVTTTVYYTDPIPIRVPEDFEAYLDITYSIEITIPGGIDKNPGAAPTFDGTSSLAAILLSLNRYGRTSIQPTNDIHLTSEFKKISLYSDPMGADIGTKLYTYENNNTFYLAEGDYIDFELGILHRADGRETQTSPVNGFTWHTEYFSWANDSTNTAPLTLELEYYSKGGR